MSKFYTVVLTLLLSVSLLDVSAQQRNFWSPVAPSSVPGDLFEGAPAPASFQLFHLEKTSFRNSMLSAPSERSVQARNSGFSISFPYADGSPMAFRVVDAPVMDPALAARYPGINSYQGVSVSDPSVNIRFDVTPAGVHATISAPGRSTVYIDPAGRHRTDDLYQLVSRDDLPISLNQFHCSTDDVVTANTGNPTARIESADDGKLRTYRLALVAPFLFSNFFLDGTETTDAQRKAKVLAAQVTIITRANATFERELSLRLVLVGNNDQVIYVNSGDPYSSGGDINEVTQATIDTQIGNDFYDIGHVIQRGPDNGDAGCIGCVCVTGAKGSGMTTYQNLGATDFLVVDYLTHEMGHQLGANHTFGFNFEGTGVQVEPGSGSTIMGYAGITGSTDVQAHSDDYFQTRSIQQITANIKTGTSSTCDVEIPTGNAAPVVDAGTDFIIPKSTPFVLTGTATDANSTDVLSYGWEQNDTRGSSYPDLPTTTQTTGAVFRSYLPVPVPTRTVPRLSSVLDGTNGNTWERLPSVGRLLHFRLTARDNRAGGASNATDEMTVQVSSASGPFLVTTANTAVTWDGASSQTITWDVANSTQTPVSCANVRILMSKDGGTTFPFILSASTPNDGTESIIVPDEPTTQARIKVESVGNIFFDINNVNFTVTAAPNGYSFSTPAAVNVACAGPTSASVTLATTATPGYTTPIILSATLNPAGTTVSFAPSTIAPGASTVVTFNGVNTLPNGTYIITVTGVSGAVTRTRDLTFVVQTGTPPVINAGPQPVTTCENTQATFTVNAPSAISYQWRVRTTPTGPFVAIAGETGSSLNIDPVIASMNGYAYDVVVTGQCGVSTSSSALLTVQNAPVITAQPQAQTLCLGSNASFSVTATGTGLTYLWQVSTDGTTYTNAGGTNNASTYTVSNIQTSMNNFRYRVVVSGTCAPSVNSTGAVLTVVSPAAIAAGGNPTAQVICETGTVSYSVTPAGNATLYQWQVSTNGGASYTDIANGTFYSGVTTSTLTLTSVSAALNNNLYRAGVYNATCTSPVYSTGALLTVNARPTVTLSAAPLTEILPGQSTTLTATILPSATGFNISWTRNEVVLPGVTGTTYVVDSVEVGNYQVSIVNQVTGCNNQSNVVAIGTSASQRLFVFPTPNNGTFTVSYYNTAGTSTRQTLSIFDSKGAQVYYRVLNVSGLYTLNSVNIAGVAKGVYYIVIGDANGKKITDSRILVH